MQEILKYIAKLEQESFEGWDVASKSGYLTACTSIKEKVKTRLQDKKVQNNLREEFVASINASTPVDLFLQDTNTAYIAWLENKLKGNVKTPCSPTCTRHVTHPCEKCGQQWD